MKFPFTPKHLIHNSGSKILEVIKPFHERYPASDGYSQDCWGMRCRVEWCDTKKVSEADIFFANLGHADEGGHAEFCELSKAMTDYLNEHGEWNPDDGPQGWVAHRLSRGLRERAYPKREAARRAKAAT